MQVFEAESSEPRQTAPTTDGREIMLTRYTQPEKDHQILLAQLQMSLPEQAPPKIQAQKQPDFALRCSADLFGSMS